MAHQPAISFSNSFHFPFNSAGGRTSNVSPENMKNSTHIVLTALLILTSFQLSAGVNKPIVVTVRGQVTRPGAVEYRDNTTIYSMIFAAGGPTVFGSLERVKVLRDGKQLQLDLTKEKVKKEELAMPDDVIEVPMTCA